jgi:putative membrane protein
MSCLWPRDTVESESEVSNMWGWHYGGWAAWGMGVGMIAFWALVILVVVWLVRQSTSPRSAGPEGMTRAPDARQVLDNRFAGGEIDEDEYRARKATLLGNGTDGSDRSAIPTEHRASPGSVR